MKGQLKLFKVVFFTKDDADPKLDDSNICFITRAYNTIEAARVTEAYWKAIPKHYNSFAVAAIEFGIDPFNSDPKIISGPAKDRILELQKGIDNFIYWPRDEANEPWMNATELHKGNIVYYEAR